MTEWTSIEELCDRHLHGRPSPPALAQMKKVENERPEVLAFVQRAFRLMEICGTRAVDITPHHAWGMSTFIAGFLPTAWGGSIPPFTWEHRHKRIDAYLASNPWIDAGRGTRLLEMGCGFPPKTAVDVTHAHPDWEVIGADPCFDEFLLYDEEGNYACLNREGIIRYFHAAGGTAQLSALYRDKPATLHRFATLFARLLPKLPQVSDGELVKVEENGARLIRHPLRLYEAANLTFAQAGIGAEFAPVNIVRCFNVLVFLDAQFHKEAEHWALRTLRPGGLFICGRDSARTTEAAYLVFRREGGELVQKEFAISIDGVRNFNLGPWFSLHENGGETWMQAKLTSRLRRDADFINSYNARYDDMLAEKGLFVRDADGFLAAPPDQCPQEEWIDALEQILLQLEAEGFPERAATVLRKAGLNAWVNQVGHVAVDPATLCLLD